MNNELAELSQRIDALRQQQAQHEENIQLVRQKLADADARRRSDTENPRRWNHVLDNLEACLDDAKSRLESCRLAIKRTENEMALLREKKERESRAAWTAPDPELAEMLPELSGEAMQAARTILETPLEDIGKMSLEEVALLHDQVAEQQFEEALSDTDRLMGRLEFANQMAPEQAEDAAPPQTQAPEQDPEQRKQRILRSAMEHIRTGQLEEMSLEEIRLIISCYNLLTRRLKSTPRDERLKRILGAAVKVLQRRLLALKREQDSEADGASR